VLKLKLWAASLVLLVSALAASWLGGRKKAQTDAKIVEMKQYANTRKKMDAVELSDDPAVLRDWLRERGKSGGDM
jgi:hypothetical protein